MVLGASGATGKLLVQQLLDSKVEGIGEIEVIAVIRNAESFSKEIKPQENLQLLEASISEASEDFLIPYLKDCDAVFSCLGHNLTCKGIFGKPKLLVTDAVEKIYNAIELINPEHKTKFILMSSSGVSNRDTSEKPPFSQRLVISIIRALLAPHSDNEKAAGFLQQRIGQNHSCIEWVVVRPDSLTNEDKVTDFKVYPSPISNVIFNSGKTSRINVANFMTTLVRDTDLWTKWKGQMPVLYNREG